MRHSPYADKVLVAHFMVADTVNDMNDNLFWLPMGELAKKMRASRPTAIAAMQKLRDDGFVELVEESKGGGAAGEGTSVWRFLYPEKPVVFETRRRRAVSTGLTLDRQSSVKPPNSSVKTSRGSKRGASLLNPREPKEPALPRFPETTPEWKAHVESIAESAPVDLFMADLEKKVTPM